MTNQLGCAGGWCQSREKCAHYLLGQATEDIRLCSKEENPMVIKEYETEEKSDEERL
jgi:hypothetical protein